MGGTCCKCQCNIYPCGYKESPNQNNIKEAISSNKETSKINETNSTASSSPKVSQHDNNDNNKIDINLTKNNVKINKQQNNNNNNDNIVNDNNNTTNSVQNGKINNGVDYNSHDDNDDNDDNENSPLAPIKTQSTAKSPTKTPTLDTIHSDSEHDDDGIIEHAMIDDTQSESVPINNKDKDKDNDKDNDNINKNMNDFPAIAQNTSSLLKIQVSAPFKKTKPLISGTSLFGVGPVHGTPKKNPKQKGSRTSSQSFLLQNTMSLRSFDGLPAFDITRSNTLTLDSLHKKKLDKRRQSSLLVRRNKTTRNLPIKINQVWGKFSKYVVDKMLEERQQKRDIKEQIKKDKDKDNTDIELTPEPDPTSGDILDKIINAPTPNKPKDKFFDEDVVNLGNPDANDDKKHDHPAAVLQIDPRLFINAKQSVKDNSFSSSSNSSSGSDNDDSSDGSSSSNSMIDVYGISLTYSQYNIVLNNSGIEVSPDMSAALIYQLLDINNMISDDIRNLGLASENNHNNPLKERSFHNKQFKLITKCNLTYSMIDTLMRYLSRSNNLCRQDKSLNPKHLSYKKRNLVIWDKIFSHLINSTSFNVESEYLFGALSADDLQDGDNIILMLSSLTSHWQHRVQLMEYIDDKMSSGSDMERDIFFASILADNNNYLKILRGWSVQLTDDRSGVARTAVTLLPALLSSLLLCVQFPAIFFDKNNIIDPIYHSIFLLVKNRRLKDMADDAYDSLIQITDIFAEVATDLKDYSLLKIIVDLLEEQTNPKINKHDKARESCIGCVGFLLYGVEEPVAIAINNTNALKPSQKHSSKLLGLNENKVELIQTPMGSLKGNDIEMPDTPGPNDIKGVGNLPDHIRGFSNKLGDNNNKKIANDKTGTKLSSIMQRAYLLDNDSFIKSLGNILLCGVTDKSESCRRKSFKLLQRFENHSIKPTLTDKTDNDNNIDISDTNLLIKLEKNWDYNVMKKYNGWKRLENRKKNSKLKVKKKRGRKKKKSSRKNNKKGAKNKTLLKNQVKNNKNKKKINDKNDKNDDKPVVVPSKVTNNNDNDNQNNQNNQNGNDFVE